MVVDSSAVVAIIQQEPDREKLQAALQTASFALLSIGAPAVLECTMVLEARLGSRITTELDLFISEWKIEIVPFDLVQLSIAREAFRRYGRGRGSKARLNFGDCCTYALAKLRVEPLLFIGDDFHHTDIVAAV
jgi:ribonuclease VapC